jgi:hypothetical protein
MKTMAGNILVRERSTVQSCPAAPFCRAFSKPDRQRSAILGRTVQELGGINVGKTLEAKL